MYGRQDAFFSFNFTRTGKLKFLTVNIIKGLNAILTKFAMIYEIKYAESAIITKFVKLDEIRFAELIFNTSEASFESISTVAYESPN